MLLDEAPLGAQLVAWLQQRGQDVIAVRPGRGEGARTGDLYEVRPSTRADYAAVLTQAEQQGRRVNRVVHLWMVEDEEEPEVVLERGFYSLMALTQALGDCGVDDCRLDVVSTAMQQVTGGERVVPAKATVLGPCTVIPQEYTEFRARSIDVEPTTSLDALAGELLASDADEVVAWREGARWVQRFAPATLETGGTSLREGGVYLITGGLGGIALGLAEHLATTVRARLVLVGRTALPPREEWPRVVAAAENATVVRRIQAVEQLEQTGAEVLVLQADVTDRTQMTEAVQRAVARFGALHGVLHTAGVPGVGLLQLKTREAAARVLAPKVQGTLALVEALRRWPSTSWRCSPR